VIKDKFKDFSLKLKKEARLVFNNIIEQIRKNKMKILKQIESFLSGKEIDLFEHTELIL